MRQFLALWDRWIDREDRLNFRATLIASVVANSAPSGKKRRKAVKPHDLIPLLKERNDTQECNSVEDQVAALKLLYGSQQFETEQPTDE